MDATYNVNLYKFDSETGKPLADSHWDILERFDDSQLDNTDLDRKPENPGEYTSGLGSLNSTDWGDDSVEDNYNGDMGVTDSDTNKYNWGMIMVPSLNFGKMSMLIRVTVMIM